MNEFVYYKYFQPYPPAVLRFPWHTAPIWLLHLYFLLASVIDEKISNISLDCGSKQATGLNKLSLFL